MNFARSAGPNKDETSPYYGYVPYLPPTAVITGLFVISTLLHLGQAIRYKVHYMLLTAFVCGLFEVAGWSARIHSHFHPKQFRPWLIQSIATLNGPNLLIIAYFVILADVIARVGPCYSRLRPKAYATVFITAIFLSTIVQGAGGAYVVFAARHKKNTANAARIMFGGVAIQLLAITISFVFAIEFLCRFRKGQPFNGREPPISSGPMEKRAKKTLIGAMFSAVLIYVRSAYRIVALAGGLHGRIIKHELCFTIFEGTLIVIAMFGLNDAHPGRLPAPESAPVTEIVTFDSSSEFHAKPKETA